MGKNRWDELADILVNYSTQVQKGDRVLVTMMETDTFPLARAVHASAVRAGAVARSEGSDAIRGAGTICSRP